MLEKIYNHSPVWCQNVMCSVKGWLISRRRYARGFFEQLEKLEKRQIDPVNELSRFLDLARSLPAYKQLLGGKDGRLLTDYPIINKAYVREHFSDFVNGNYKGSTISVHTSGTTGSSLEVPQSLEFEHKQWATWWRFREELGIKFGTWYGWFGCGEMIVLHLFDSEEVRYAEAA